MAVTVQGLNAFGGGSAYRYFADDFSTYANAAAMALSGNYTTFGVSRRNIVVTGTPGLRFDVAAAVGGGSGLLIPTKVTAALNRSQFSQFKVLANNGTGANTTRPSIWCFTTGLPSQVNNNLTGYCVEIRNNTPDARLVKSEGGIVAGQPTTNTLLLALTLPALGVLVRLEARKVVRIGMDNIDFEVFYDGVSQGTASDTAIGFGLPGFGTHASDATGSAFEIGSFAAGVL